MAEDNVNIVTTGTNVTGDGQTPEPVVRQFTQDELNAIVADRLQRERAKFADYEQLQERAAQWEDYQRAQLSELEAAQARAQELEAERDVALQRANDRLIMAALTAEAAKMGFADPADAFELGNLATITVSDDGQVEGVAEAVSALAKAKPYLVGRRLAPGLDAGAGGGGPSPRGVQLTQEEIDIAKKLGLSPEQMARGKATGSGLLFTEDERQKISLLQQARGLTAEELRRRLA